jgi:hypothetical protein
VIVTTSCCSNYLAKAATLAATVKSVMPDITFVVCLVEREIPDAATKIDGFDRVVLARDLGFEKFENFLFPHDIVEASTAVKGRLMQVLLEEEAVRRGPGVRGVVYLDPDVQVFSRMAEVEQLLGGGAEIILTPHLTSPEEKETREATLDAIVQNELCALRHGVFNLGFLGLAPGRESQRFLSWWSSRLHEFCMDAIEDGMFTDQKWVDLAPGFFTTTILRHPGYNVAPWNFSTRPLTRRQGLYEACGESLRFLHFSGTDAGGFEAMRAHFLGEEDEIVAGLFADYQAKLALHGQAAWGACEWSYARYLSGERISSEVRARFRNSDSVRQRVRDPFLHSNETLLRELQP